MKGIIKESTAGQSYIDTRNGDSLQWSPISKESYSGSITEKKIYIYCICIYYIYQKRRRRRRWLEFLITLRGVTDSGGHGAL